MTQGDTEPAAAGRSTAKIFISYSRRDLEFADRIDAALKARGFDTLIDRSEIYALEDWWKRIEALIAQADTIVFILSPDAVASDVCQSEVRFAAELNKRLAPIVFRRVDDSRVPAELARLNFIFFDEAAQFDASLDRLAEALETDIDWVRKHTELVEQARRWAGVGRPGPRGLLLRPPVLDEAERWIASRPHNAPLPTEAAQAFIAASRQAHTRRRNIVSLTLGAGLFVALGLAGLAYWQRAIAVEQRKVATQQRDSALLNQSRFLMGIADAHWENGHGNLELAALVARAALPADLRHPERPLYAPAVGVLASAQTFDHSTLLLVGHRDAIDSVAYSPDGKRILTASGDGTARVWDARTGAQLLMLNPRTGPVHSAAWSPDGRLIATGSGDLDSSRNKPDAYWVRIWDAETGEQRATLQGHTNSVESVAWSPDGLRIVSASDDKTARVWDSKTGEQLLVLQGHTASINSAAWSPDGSKIVTASLDKGARIWDAGTGAQLAELRGHTSFVVSAAWSPDGSRIVTASQDFSARIWNAADASPLRELKGFGRAPTSAVFSPDGARVLVASVDPMVSIWDSNSGQALGVFHDYTGIGYGAAWSPDGTKFVSGGGYGAARVWAVEKSLQVTELTGHTAPVTTVGWSPDGMQLATLARDGTARVWDAKTGAARLVLNSPAKDKNITSLMWSPDGTRLLTRSSGNDAQIWDARSGSQIAVLTGHSNQLNSASFSPDGSRVATASADKSARVWNAETGAQLLTLEAPDALTNAIWSPDGTRLLTLGVEGAGRLWDARTGSASAVLTANKLLLLDGAWSPDGSFVAIGSVDKTARIWDAATGAQVSVLKHGGWVAKVRWAPDGRRLLTVSDNASIWDAKSETLLTELSGPGGGSFIHDAAWSPDGSRIATALDDSTVRVWDPQTGAAVLVLAEPMKDMNSAVWSPDGTRLATASGTEVARIWDAHAMSVADLAAYASIAALRSLSPEERAAAFLIDPGPADGASSTGSTSRNIASPCDRAAGDPFDPRKIGPGVENMDAERAVALCREELKQTPDDPRLLFELGYALLNAGKSEEAVAPLRAAADRGYAAAADHLGDRYATGDGISQKASEALRLYRQAAEGGFIPAYSDIGTVYWRGLGVDADHAEALRWFQQGAEHGDPYSHKWLAELYERGDGVPQNFEQALFHYAVEARLFAAAGEGDGAALACARRGSIARLLAPETVVRLAYEVMDWHSSSP